MEQETDILVNKKTKYRPFKKSFKNPANTITKWIFDNINKAAYKSKNKPGGFSWSRWKKRRTDDVTDLPAIARKLCKKQFASTKGFSKLRTNGQLY